MSDGPSLGQRLRDFRRARGWTIEQLAGVSGVSPRTISDIERGRSVAPHSRTIEELATALELTPPEHQLLSGLASAARLGPALRPSIGRLPPLPAHFVGRRPELDRIAGVLRATSRPRIVVLSGMGGLGKTTLALQAAYAASDSFPDGACFVSLAGLDEAPMPVAQAAARILTAAGLGGRDIPSDPEERTRVLEDTLAHRRLLLVLDNAADEAQVRSLLPPAGGSAAIITSRRALGGLSGVDRVMLAPLDHHDSITLLTEILGHGYDDGAVALSELAAVCGRCPLALTIAANRLLTRPGWSVQTIVDRLADEDLRIARLTAGDLAMHNTFTLSYDQLDGLGRRTFRRMGLVEGADWSAAAAGVLTGVTALEADRALDGLVELSLLEATADQRYRFHDLVKLFARQRLREEERPEVIEAAAEEHRNWLLVNAVRAGQVFEPVPTGIESLRPTAPLVAFVGPEAAATADAWLQAEADNWLAAFREESERGHHTAVLEVAEAMHWYSDRTVYWGHWREVFDRARRAAAALGRPDLEATQLNYLAWVATECEGRFAEGRELAEQALAIAVEVGDPTQQAWAHMYLARALRGLDRVEASLPETDRAAELFEAVGDPEGQLQTLLSSLISVGRLARHTDVRVRAAHILGKLDAPDSALSATIAAFSRTTTHQTLAESFAATREWTDSEFHFRAAVRVAREASLPIREAWTLHGYATTVLLHTGRPQDARATLRRAERLFRDSGNGRQASELAAVLAKLDAGT